ncbi:right-handed parallel beta-helix repeat-containing protein [Sandaracinus amylolyticus]|uniref:right-handed parallel beta-helix repeat-containing protein n=1 Tax=Sandaracinus amylolyticus TaxID=927083 RepID=UPI001F456B44|nr:right-handed parallel beta-helix repeat-containing protein [Sandaracinus amylolyticus]
MQRSTSAALVALGLASVCCGPETYCDTESLTGALEAAQPGDVVHVGRCRFPAQVVIPPDVTLAGEGDASVLESAGDGTVVEVAQGTGAVLRDLRIDVLAGGYGVRAVGDGDATLQNVTISVTRGVGVGLQGRSRVVLREVKLEGPIDETNAGFAPTMASETGTYGVIAIDVGSAEDATSGLRIEAARIEGFALGAVAVDGGRLAWNDLDADLDEDGVDDVDVRDVRGAAIAVFDAPAELQGVEIASMLAGVGLPGVAIAAVSSPELALERVRVEDGEGFGVFGEGSALTMRGLTISEMGLAGVRVQRGTIDAEDVTIESVGGAGVLAVDSGRIELRRTTLSRQREALIFDDLGIARSMGDGLTVWRSNVMAPGSAIDIVLEDVRFEDNARAGLLVDAGGTDATIVLDRVSARARGSAFGVVAQDATLPAGWDSAVVREDAALANDAAFGGGLEIAGIIMPPAIFARPGSL